MIDCGNTPVMVSSSDVKTVSHLIDLHIADFQEVGKPIRRSKMAVLESLKRNLGYVKIKNLDRLTLIQYGRKRAKDNADPVIMGKDRLRLVRNFGLFSNEFTTQTHLWSGQIYEKGKTIFFYARLPNR